MALVPIIQPPIMKALTTKKERQIVMKQLRPVSKKEKIIFPIIVTVVVVLIIPKAAPLIGMLMLGNLFRESGVVARLNDTAQNALNNIVVIFLGVTVGATAKGSSFLDFIPRLITGDLLDGSVFITILKSPVGILAMGLAAFCFGTMGGVLLGKLMNKLSKKRNKPAYRSCRCFGCTNGGTCCSGGRTGRKPSQLPSHACHGTECCWRYRPLL